MSTSSPSEASAPGSRALLRRLEWTALRRLDGLLQGDYRTLFRGFGLDLADLREYQYGDDVRHIDWNVTARLDTPYVKQYHEDREITAWFLVDLSGSVDFGSRETKKQAVATQFVALLARLLTRRGNRVGALLYGSSVDTVIPARSGRRHVLQILHRMHSRPAAPATGETKLGELLQAGANAMSRRRWCSSSPISSALGWAARPASSRCGTGRRRAAARSARARRRISACSSSATLKPASSSSSIRMTRRSASARRRRDEARGDAARSVRDAGVDAMGSRPTPISGEISRFIDLRRRRGRAGAKAAA
jgi:uncharacterized protein (DUF58 family)